MISTHIRSTTGCFYLQILTWVEPSDVSVHIYICQKARYIYSLTGGSPGWNGATCLYHLDIYISWWLYRALHSAQKMEELWNIKCLCTNVVAWFTIPQRPISTHWFFVFQGKQCNLWLPHFATFFTYFWALHCGAGQG